MNRKSCEGCRYYKNGNGTRSNSSDRFCHYMIDTGMQRNCDPAKCNKKVVDVPYKNKPIPWTLKKKGKLNYGTTDATNTD